MISKSKYFNFFFKSIVKNNVNNCMMIYIITYYVYSPSSSFVINNYPNPCPSCANANFSLDTPELFWFRYNMVATFYNLQ